jgi:hypothetical protein
MVRVDGSGVIRSDATSRTTIVEMLASSPSVNVYASRLPSGEITMPSRSGLQVVGSAPLVAQEVEKLDRLRPDSVRHCCAAVGPTDPVAGPCVLDPLEPVVEPRAVRRPGERVLVVGHLQVTRLLGIELMRNELVGIRAVRIDDSDAARARPHVCALTVAHRVRDHALGPDHFRGRR